MDLLFLIIEAILILFSIIAHEMAHAYMSFFLGDPTPKETGRLTPNPLKHLDIWGLIFMLVFRIGWAKPVRINSEYYKNRRVGIFLVALAGPLTNFIIFIVALLLSVLVFKLNIDPNIKAILFNILFILASINISLCLFNLIPIPPLDGSRIVGSFLSANAYIGYMKVERYGFYIIMALLGLDSILAYARGAAPLFEKAIQTIFYFFFDVILKIFV